MGSEGTPSQWPFPFCPAMVFSVQGGGLWLQFPPLAGGCSIFFTRPLDRVTTLVFQSTSKSPPMLLLKGTSQPLLTLFALHQTSSFFSSHSTLGGDPVGHAQVDKERDGLMSAFRLVNSRKVYTIRNFEIPKAKLYWRHHFSIEESKPTLVFTMQCLYS